MKDGVLMIIYIYPQGRLRTAKVSLNLYQSLTFFKEKYEQLKKSTMPIKIFLLLHLRCHLN